MVSEEETTGVRVALEDAIRAAGTQSALAELIGQGVKTGHIFYWLRQGAVPEKHCAVIEQGTGVSRKRLCPGWQRVWPELAAEEPAVGATSERRRDDRRHGDRRVEDERRAGDERRSDRMPAIVDSSTAVEIPTK